MYKLEIYFVLNNGYAVELLGENGIAEKFNKTNLTNLNMQTNNYIEVY